MIQEYLNEQFIQTTEDANFEKLKKTCVEVAKRIGKDKGKILSYSLAVFDPEVPPDNPDIVEIKNLIIENWQTFLANSKDTTLTIIRAVMLDALHTVSKETGAACLIWFTSRNSFRYFKLGREKEILTKFLLELGNKIEKQVSEIWTFSPDAEIEIPKITPAVVDANELGQHVPANAINAAGVAETINKALKKQVGELKESQRTFMQLNSLMHMRAQLLWWKEAGYSLVFKDSYRKLGDGALQTTIAFDYSTFIPEMYPVSVDYFLAESHRSFRGDSEKVGEKKNKISELLKLVEQASSILKVFIPEYNGQGGRISFVNFVQGLIHGKFQSKQFKGLVGVADSTELSLEEFTVWLFHDLHSIKLSTSK